MFLVKLLLLVINTDLFRLSSDVSLIGISNTLLELTSTQAMWMKFLAHENNDASRKALTILKLPTFQLQILRFNNNTSLLKKLLQQFLVLHYL